MSESPNRVLEFLTAPPKPDGDACRSNRRQTTYAVVEMAWSGERGWRSAPARLINLSRGGAGLAARQAPELGNRARLRFTSGDGTPWVEGKVVGVDRDEDQRFRVRLRFDEPCPGLLMRLAVLGDDEPETKEFPPGTTDFLNDDAF